MSNIVVAIVIIFLSVVFNSMIKQQKKDVYMGWSLGVNKRSELLCWLQYAMMKKLFAII